MSSITQNDPEDMDDPSIPSHWKKDQLSDHEYDGIQEYDNPTPAWWTVLFIVSIFWALFYFIYYHSGVPDRSIKDEFAESYAADIKKRFATMGELTVSEQNMLLWMQKPDYMAVGESTFKQNCVSCHGSDGQGLVGPNLTDDYYKNVKRLTDIAKVVSNGAANGNMPSWSSRLHPNEIALVASYVASLRGKNLPGPRGVEGDKIAPWPAATTTTAASASAPATAR
jgi:cytochrome c oxidase cbb3-type subunit 3